MSKAGLSISSSEGREIIEAGAGTAPRRNLLRGGATGGLLLALAGCGFQPLYGPSSGAGGLARDQRRELAGVRVDYLGERTGVLLRRGLERRFESAGGSEIVPAKYTLQLTIAYAVDILGYRRDGAISRIRFTATSSWVLLTRGDPAAEIGRGVVRTIDAFNVPDFQFFSAEVSRETMERRLLDEIVDQVFLSVAARLRQYQPPPEAAAPASGG